MTGCPQATLRDGEGRSVFVKVLKNSLASDNVEVSIQLKSFLPPKFLFFFLHSYL